MGFTYSETTCGTWCDGQTPFPPKSTCTNRDRICYQRRFAIPYMADVAMLCDERCVRRERPKDWDPSGWAAAANEVASEVGAQTDALARAAKGALLTLAEWAGVLDKYRELRAGFISVAPELERSGGSVRRRTTKLRADQQKIDREILASGQRLDGFGALGLTPQTAVVIGVSGVAIAVSFAYFMKSWMERTTALLLCTKAADKVPPEDRAKFITDCVSDWGWLKIVGAVTIGVGAVYIVYKMGWYKKLPVVGRLLPARAGVSGYRRRGRRG